MTEATKFLCCECNQVKSLPELGKTTSIHGHSAPLCYECMVKDYPRRERRRMIRRHMKNMRRMTQKEKVVEV